MIRFTPQQIAIAAEALKIRRLVKDPDMDKTAVLLNREPTHEEIRMVRLVGLALGYAAQGNQPLTIAVALESEE